MKDLVNIHNAFNGVKKYLDDTGLKQGFYTYQADYSIDIHSDTAEWFRIIFKSRHDYLNHIRNICAIILDHPTVGFNLDCWNGYHIFVSINNWDNSLKLLDDISDTTDPLYERSLFDVFVNEFWVGYYEKTANGFKFSLSTKRECKEFSNICAKVIPEYQLDFYKDGEWICEIIMKDKIDNSKKYGTIFPMVKIVENHKKDSNLLDVINNLEPSEEDNELYKHLLEVLKNYETGTIASKS